jgi:hypothetical protein
MRIGLTAWLLFAAGCAEQLSGTAAVKPFSEPLTAEEWQKFVSLMDGVGADELSGLQSVFPSPPDWQATRSLPVSDLIAAEQKRLDEHWDPQFLALRFSQKPGLARALRRARLSPEQFAGLALAAAAAAARSRLPENDPPDETLRRGRAVVDGLRHDQRLFSSLDLEDRYHVLDQALWLHRLDRIDRLRKVPAENVAWAREHADWLTKMLPACFSNHPLADITDLLGEQGLPFIELPESGSDARMEWDPAAAIRGGR